MPQVNRTSLAVFAVIVALAGRVHAQTPAGQKPFEPQSGQAGKDVVWVPTPQSLVDRMMELAQVTPNDYLIDLGSGDGRTVITAAKRGARALGIEYNPDMVELSKRNAVEAGVTSRANFMKADLFETDLSQATVITLFLLPDINLRLRPKILDLKPGTRIVSNTFTMGDWNADQTATADQPCVSWCIALLWIVPAKVAGAWHVGSQTLTLTQTYQEIGGTLGATAISDGKLDGDRITFKVNGTTYSGQVKGNQMTGSASGGSASGAWTATRQ